MKKWLKRNKMTGREFAKSLPVAPHWVTVSRWVNGHFKPSASWRSIILAKYPSFPC